ESIVTEIPGFYEVQGAAGPNCFGFGFTQVIDPQLGDITLEPFANDSICGAGTCIQLQGINLFNNNNAVEVEWDGPPSFDEWYAEQINPIQGICGFEEGLYTVTLRTACDTVVVSYDSNSPECSEISGTLYLDSDGDCDLDDADTPAPGFIVTLTNDATGEMYYAWTGEDGNWSILVPDGTYTIAPVIEDGQPLEQCDPAASVTLNGAAVTGVNLFMPVLFNCPILTTEITLPFLRRCFQGCAYVHYENTGTATGEDAQVVVVLDPFFVDVIPSVDPVSVEGNVYTFDVGDLPPFSGGTIGFIFTISCDAELGQSHCIDANITPDTPCHNNDDWNGALVEISSAECTGDTVVFSITNIGVEQMSIPLNYVIVEDGIMLTPEPETNGMLAPSEVYYVTVAANGATYGLITNQEPNAPGTDQPTAVLEGCNGNGGNFSTGFTNLLPLASGNPASSSVCRENVGSYDPNDKMGYPLGWDGGNIEEGTRIDYEIRFQNTGTDTAFTVVISDTLAPELDLATFKMEAASHTYSVTIDTHRVITWTFDNILLPDSSTNLLLSQGSVVFSIDHDPSLIPGDVIDNEAAIYFDFNEPIITNVSRHIIAKEGLPVNLRSIMAQSVNLSVYPNPASNLIKVEAPDADIRPSDILQVTDLHGRPLKSVRYDQVGQGLDVSGLPAGYYLLLVNDAGGFTRGRTAFVVSSK
ncbi:MAG: T9SS type A sorting domain-containing protein, partial [Bacteroidota bacterium]